MRVVRGDHEQHRELGLCSQVVVVQGHVEGISRRTGRGAPPRRGQDSRPGGERWGRDCPVWNEPLRVHETHGCLPPMFGDSQRARSRCALLRGAVAARSPWLFFHGARGFASGPANGTARTRNAHTCRTSVPLTCREAVDEDDAARHPRHWAPGVSLWRRCAREATSPTMKRPHCHMRRPNRAVMTRSPEVRVRRDHSASPQWANRTAFLGPSDGVGSRLRHRSSPQTPGRSTPADLGHRDTAPVTDCEPAT